MATSKPVTEQKGSESQKDPSQQGRITFLVTQVTLRVLAIAFTLTSVTVMVTSKQTIDFLGIPQKASYSMSQAYRFLVIVNSVVAAFSFFSLALVYFMFRSGSSRKNNLIVILHMHDLVMVLVMMGGCAAASGVGYLGKYGQWEVGWLPVCGLVKHYCHQIMLSFVFAYLALLCYFALTLLAAFNFKLMPMSLAH